MSTPSLLNIPYLYKAGTLYSQIPESGAGDFSVTRATTPVGGRSTRINKDGLIELVADNVPRLDYPLGGAVNGCPALLVEPAATNGIRNNSMVGAVAGSPGTLPTNWSNSGSGLARQSVATGTLNGIPYVDIRISGTANNTFHDIFWETSNAIAASVGQDWVASCYLQIIAQPNPPVDYRFAMREFNSGGGFLGIFFQSTPLSISTTSLNRFSFTRALNQATVAFVNPSLFATLVNGQTYDFTIRIGYPQMERGTVATSVIPTTTQAITRGAEVVTNTVASSLIGQTEGTLYAEFSVDFNNRNADILNLNDGSSNNGFFMSIRSSAVVQLIVRRAASNALIFQRTGAYPAGVNKLAIAYKNGDFAICLNGTTVQIDTTNIIMPSVSINRISLGQSFLYTLDQQLRIRAAALYPNRLTNAQLEYLTSFASYEEMALALSYTLI